MALLAEPLVRHATRRPLDLMTYRARGAEENDYAELLTQPTLIYDDEQQCVTIVYLELADDCTDIVSALRRVEFEQTQRTSGMKSRSRIFGFSPRVTIRQDFCTATALAREDPDAHATIAGYAGRVARYYEQYNPTLYAEHQRQVERVLPTWRLEESVFTSGIVNKDNPLPYHFDTGNFARVWSNMLVFKDRIAGGYLSVPQYDVGFELKDNSLLMFDGQALLHGVTPITLLSPDSHRFSVVFYSLKGMWGCLEPQDEVKRIRRLRTEREYKRLEQASAPGAVLADGTAYSPASSKE